jgi:hypothetical protein
MPGCRKALRRRRNIHQNNGGISSISQRRAGVVKCGIIGGQNLKGFFHDSKRDWWEQAADKRSV